LLRSNAEKEIILKDPMLKLLLFTTLVYALPPVGKPTTGKGLVHNVVAGGTVVSDDTKDCVEKEIRRRTVIVNVGGDRKCSGVLLDNQTVAMAGHCTPEANNAKSRKILREENAAKVTGIIFYNPATKKYQEGPSINAASVQFQGDLEKGTIEMEDRDQMVVKLTKPIPGVTPIKHTPKRDLRTNLGQDLIVAGFGYDENENLIDKVKYLKAKGRIESKTSSTLQIKPDNPNDLVMKGDSGGGVWRANPETCEVELAGITKGTVLEGDLKGLSTSDAAENLAAHIKSLNQSAGANQPAAKATNNGSWKATVKPARQ
jgi:hypothetical protein